MDHFEKLEIDARILKLMIGGLYALAAPAAWLLLRIAGTVGAIG